MGTPTPLDHNSPDTGSSTADPRQIQTSRQSKGKEKNNACILANQRREDLVGVVTFTDRALAEKHKRCRLILCLFVQQSTTARGIRSPRELSRETFRTMVV